MINEFYPIMFCWSYLGLYVRKYVLFFRVELPWNDFIMAILLFQLILLARACHRSSQIWEIM